VAANVTVGAFGFGAASQAALVVDAVNEVSSGSARYFDLNLLGDQTFSLGGDVFQFDGVDICKLRFAYIHGFSYQYPVVPRLSADTDWSLWQTKHVLDQQRYSAILSLVQELERHGVCVISGLRGLLGNFMKYEQLQRLRRQGFSVPPMICTNDRESTDKFCEQHEQLIWRPATGRAAWQHFGERQREHLLAPEKSPIIISAVIPGEYLRSYYLFGQDFLHLQHRGAGYYPMETLETFCEAEGLSAPDFDPVSVLELSRGFFSLSQVVSGPVRWIYDLDADPALTALPVKYRELLIRAFALCLSGRKSQLDSLVRPVSPQQRESLFLRRMLGVLFDMEASKHRPLPKE